jgi:hypothetical protein
MKIDSAPRHRGRVWLKRLVLILLVAIALTALDLGWAMLLRVAGRFLR